MAAAGIVSVLYHRISRDDWPDNSAREFDPTPLIQHSSHAFIAVVIQARLGAFGFLQSEQMMSDNGLNAGITDVKASLEWVQQYIWKFGGDPGRVTIWGQSSGGGSILNVIAAQAEQGRPRLWNAAILSSPYLTPMGSCNDTYWRTQFHNFSRDANCTDDLECLRNAPTDALKELNHKYDSILQLSHTSAYEPCIEGPGGYIVHNTATQLINGDIGDHIYFGGSNLHDGFGFGGLNVTGVTLDEAFRDFLGANFPLSNSQIQRTLEMYPASDFSSIQLRAAQAFQDVIFAWWVGVHAVTY